MKKHLRHIASAVTAGALALLTACGASEPAKPSGSSNSSASASDAGAAMGRYIETELDFPEEVRLVMGGLNRLSDGSFRILTSPSERAITGPWTLYASNDGGDSWTKQDAPWLTEFDQSMIDSIEFGEDGGVYLSTATYTPEFEAMLAEALETGVMPDFSEYPPTILYRVEPDGTLKECPIVPERAENGRMEVYGMLLTKSGDILLEYSEGEGARYIQYDPATGEQKGSFLTGDGRGMIYRDDQGTEILGVATDVCIEQYNLATGETIDSIPFDNTSGNYALLTVSADEKSLYRCDTTGIYRFVFGGSMWERIVDGELTSLGMPSVYLGGIAERDNGDFYVLTESDGIYLPISFSYSADTPAVPSMELVVYSLTDNNTIRQTMGLFQRQNPDIRVRFDVAMGPDSVMEKSDAIRTLNTELLAGKGPDLLVLDSLPLDSYMEKGVLADLSALQPLLENGELLKNVTSTYAPYAVPLRFGTMQMWGDSDMIAQAKDLTSLADWIVADHAQNPASRPLRRMKPEELLEDFYLAFSPTWRNEDGSIREAEFAQYLTDLGRIADSAVEPPLVGMFTPELFEQYTSVEYQGYFWANDFIRIVMGLSNNVEDLAGPDAAAAYRGDGAFALMQNVYVPEVTLGINQNSKLIDKAVQFIEIALSERVQVQQFGDGYPVNRAALAKNIENPYPPEDDGKQAPVYEGEEMRILQILWPEDSFMQSVASQMEQLQVPSVLDDVLLQMMIDETADFFAGGKSAGEAASAVAQRTQAYLAE